MKKIKINSYDSIEIDTSKQEIVSINLWYDKHTKLWIIQKLDINGNQIDNAIYISGKQNAIKEKQELEKLYNKSMLKDIQAKGTTSEKTVGAKPLDKKQEGR